VIGLQVALVAVISGGFGGVITAGFLEVYLQRRAQEEVGMYDEESRGAQTRATNR